MHGQKQKPVITKCNKRASASVPRQSCSRPLVASNRKLYYESFRLIGYRKDGSKPKVDHCRIKFSGPFFFRVGLGGPHRGCPWRPPSSLMTNHINRQDVGRLHGSTEQEYPKFFLFFHITPSTRAFRQAKRLPTGLRFTLQVTALIFIITTRSIGRTPVTDLFFLV